MTLSIDAKRRHRWARKVMPTRDKWDSGWYALLNITGLLLLVLGTFFMIAALLTGQTDPASGPTLFFFTYLSRRRTADVARL